MSNAEQIIAWIPGLTSDEVARIRAALDMSSQLGGKVKHEAIASDDLYVLDTIARFMQERGLDMSGREQLARGRGYNAFKIKIPALFKYLKCAGDRNAQRALLTIGIELLYADLVKIGIAVTSRSLMAHTHRISGVINREFPGYAQSGFIKLILRREKNVRSKQSDGTIPARSTRSGDGSPQGGRGSVLHYPRGRT